MDGIKSTEVAGKFAGYPDPVRDELLFLRRLILDTASAMEGVGEVEESLKWGEPSYTTKNGSSVRIDWKKSRPQEYAMYFNCRTKLVDTFRELHADRFRFEGNRAIVFRAGEPVPVNELKQCIAMALDYHRVKRLPLLGA